MTIDLGELTTVEPAAARSARPLPRSRRRLIQIAVVVIVVLAASVSSVRAADTPPRPVASLPIGTDARMLIAGAHAIVLDTVGTSSRITSFRLPGGGRDWIAPLTGGANNAQAFLLGSTVVAVTPLPSRNTTYAAGYDLRTGRMTWQHTVDIAFAADRIVLEYVPAAAGELLRGIDPATGSTVWSVDLPTACTNQLDSADPATVTALLETCAGDGSILRLDLATGAIVARGRFDTPRSNDYSLPGPASVTFVGDVALVAQDSADRTWVTAFRTKDLTRLWAQTPLAALAALQSCAPDLCIASVDGRLDQVDPDTGQTRRPGTDTPAPAVPYRSDIAVPEDTTMLITPDPGRDGVELIPTASVAVAPYASDGSAVRLLSAAGGDTWIARIVRSGRIVTTRLLWDLPGYGGACVIVGGYLACTGPSGRVDLRRVPGQRSDQVG